MRVMEARTRPFLMSKRDAGSIQRTGMSSVGRDRAPRSDDRRRPEFHRSANARCTKGLMRMTEQRPRNRAVLGGFRPTHPDVEELYRAPAHRSEEQSRFRTVLSNRQAVRRNFQDHRAARCGDGARLRADPRLRQHDQLIPAHRRGDRFPVRGGSSACKPRSHGRLRLKLVRSPARARTRCRLG